MTRALCFGLLLFTLACAGGGGGVSVEEAEAFGGFVLPPSADAFESRYEKGIDAYLSVRFECSSDELSKFQEELEGEWVPIEGGNVEFTHGAGKSHERWSPGEPASVGGWRRIDRDGWYARYQVDALPDGRVVVYWESFST